MAKAAKSKASSKPKGGDEPMQSAESAARDRKYEVEDGLRTLTRAEEVKGNKGLMKDIAAHAAEQADLAKRTAGMIKSGLISDKQAAKLPAAQAEGKAAAE